AGSWAPRGSDTDAWIGGRPAWPPLRSPVLEDGAGAALGACVCVLRLARIRARALPAAPVRVVRAPAGGEGGAHRYRDRLGPRACARRPPRRPARAAQDAARARQFRRGRAALAAPRPGAPGT